MRNVVISLSIILVIILIYVCQLPFIFGQTSTGFIFIKKLMQECQLRYLIDIQ